ncbi:uncharacterized protein BDZ99DRAFT_495793 [Mytilinidion resinicola]|uniref:Homeobox domain-containing protein n=1 Tax=Mytilinidion resinicola TaxID=574789 RepID=A0A6A6Z260_9PEZI|nr:uncharacterized protein BDZ99DRAFT_495793 [Mytilinidion resinicola]KAF2814275.1 hypothetical protein BDZ99DRAFT_495793 [Mytilinidion resinicola]
MGSSPAGIRTETVNSDDGIDLYGFDYQLPHCTELDDIEPADNLSNELPDAGFNCSNRSQSFERIEDDVLLAHDYYGLDEESALLGWDSSLPPMKGESNQLTFDLSTSSDVLDKFLPSEDNLQVSNRFVSLADIELQPGDDQSHTEYLPTVRSTTSIQPAFFHESTLDNQRVLSSDCALSSSCIRHPHWQGEESSQEQARGLTIDGSLLRPTSKSHSRPPPRGAASQGSIGKTNRKQQPPTAPIKAWFEAHSFRPYPTKEEEQSLIEQTGLNIQQVKRCLTNLRARTKKKGVVIAHCSSPSEIQYEYTANDNHLCRDLLTSRTTSTGEWLGMPVSPAESQSSPSGNSLTTNTSSPRVLEEGLSGSLPISSFPHRGDSPRNFPASPPGLPQFQSLNMGALRSVPGRKGKKPLIPLPVMFAGESTPEPNTISNSLPSGLQKRIFHCTFCFKHLKDRYEWKRHEASEVFATKWICMPQNTAVSNGTCVFCDTAPTYMPYACAHNIEPCLAKPLHDRTFGRKDQLKQHIQQVHLPPDQNPRASQVPTRAKKSRASLQIPPLWKLDCNAIDLRPGALWCGFCKTDLDTWTQRVEHVSAHFQNGATITDWFPKAF